jgi:hypothetical protein
LAPWRVARSGVGSPADSRLSASRLMKAFGIAAA